MNYSEWPPYVKKKFWLANTQLATPTKPQSLDTTAENAVKWLYEVLTTLDSKASALMRLNGVLIAAAAFLLGLFGRQGGTILATGSWDARLIILSALLSACSIFACLFVVNVSWPFLGETKIVDDQTLRCEDEIKRLGCASTFRQIMYRLAWWISFSASIGFLVEFVMQTKHVFTIT